MNTSSNQGLRPYPVRLEGHVDADLTRWMWLVKWILIIPHVVVLFFLWIAFSVLTVVAGFAILFTGRYPKGIFDFNVGVMRWSWRVMFYAESAFATDHYPPFSLRPDPAYPADLDVEYAPRLSRGLVLVKWWLLAIPQYVIVAVLAGGGWSGFGFRAGGWGFLGSGGLVGLLALVAIVIYAFTRTYPEGLFDTLMGMNRWVWRVFAYAALMRDEYPPFRLDLGGTDPSSPAPLTPAG